MEGMGMLDLLATIATETLRTDQSLRQIQTAPPVPVTTQTTPVIRDAALAAAAPRAYKKRSHSQTTHQASSSTHQTVYEPKTPQTFTMSQLKRMSQISLLKHFSEPLDTLTFEDEKPLGGPVSFKFRCRFYEACVYESVSYGSETRAKTAMKQHLVRHVRDFETRPGLANTFVIKSFSRDAEQAETPVTTTFIKTEQQQPLVKSEYPEEQQQFKRSRLEYQLPLKVHQIQHPMIESDDLTCHEAEDDIQIVEDHCYATCPIPPQVPRSAMKREDNFDSTWEEEQEMAGGENEDVYNEGISDASKWIKSVLDEKENERYQAIDIKPVKKEGYLIEAEHSDSGFAPLIGSEVEVGDFTESASTTGPLMSFEEEKNKKSVEIIRPYEFLPVIQKAGYTTVPADGRIAAVSEEEERNLANVAIEELRKMGSSQDAYFCSLCGGKKFAAYSSILNHLRSHAGYKPFECTICKAYFTRQHSLNYHMLIHSNETRFECGECGKKFRHPSHFKEHKRRHLSEESPYICTACDSRYKNRNTLKRHLRIAHGKVVSPQNGLDLMREGSQDLPKVNGLPEDKEDFLHDHDSLTAHNDEVAQISKQLEVEDELLNGKVMISGSEYETDEEEDEFMEAEELEQKAAPPARKNSEEEVTSSTFVDEGQQKVAAIINENAISSSTSEAEEKPKKFVASPPSGIVNASAVRQGQKPVIKLAIPVSSNPIALSQPTTTATVVLANGTGGAPTVVRRLTSNGASSAFNPVVKVIVGANGIIKSSHQAPLIFPKVGVTSQGLSGKKVVKAIGTTASSNSTVIHIKTSTTACSSSTGATSSSSAAPASSSSNKDPSNHQVVTTSSLIPKDQQFLAYLNGKPVLLIPKSSAAASAAGSTAAPQASSTIPSTAASSSTAAVTLSTPAPVVAVSVAPPQQPRQQQAVSIERQQLPRPNLVAPEAERQQLRQAAAVVNPPPPVQQQQLVVKKKQQPLVQTEKPSTSSSTSVEVTPSKLEQALRFGSACVKRDNENEGRTVDLSPLKAQEPSAIAESIANAMSLQHQQSRIHLNFGRDDQPQQNGFAYQQSAELGMRV